MCVAYVQSLGGSTDNGRRCRLKALPAERKSSSPNCVACHGEDAKGKHDVGAPDLTDASWIYGGDRQSIHTTIYAGHQGQMPSWEQRLSTTQRKILTLYVLSLSEKNP